MGVSDTPGMLDPTVQLSPLRDRPPEPISMEERERLEAMRRALDEKGFAVASLEDLVH